MTSECSSISHWRAELLPILMAHISSVHTKWAKCLENILQPKVILEFRFTATDYVTDGLCSYSIKIMITNYGNINCPQLVSFFSWGYGLFLYLNIICVPWQYCLAPPTAAAACRPLVEDRLQPPAAHNTGLQNTTQDIVKDLQLAKRNKLETSNDKIVSKLRLKTWLNNGV